MAPSLRACSSLRSTLAVCDHLGLDVVGHLYGSAANPAAGGMDQDALAGLQFTKGEYRLVGGTEHLDDSGGLHVAPLLGNLDRELLVDQRIFGVGPGCDEAEDPLAFAEPGHVGACGDDVAG